MNYSEEKAAVEKMLAQPITKDRRLYLARLAFEIYTDNSTIEDTILTIRDAYHLDVIYPCLRKY